MVITRSGPTGLRVAGHAQEGLSTAIVRAPILRQQMEEQTVGDWVNLQKSKDVIHILGAQVCYKETEKWLFWSTAMYYHLIL